MNMSTDTPEIDLAPRSALDFMYEVITNVTVINPASTANQEFAGAAENETAAYDIIRYAASRVQITLPLNMDLLLELAEERGTTKDPLECFTKRGAILYKNRGITVCFGDNKRIIEVLGFDVFSRYLTPVERLEGFWDAALYIPDMVYAS